ncbi:ubiquitin carboxyl-terminal hydrolase 1 [Ischnura elegans]|uniref:ubiquitin carboxyl-terminal hydrolase 1 n=1 Tax=Ischnura elegans TaxID=197161 RepID=UPI001ED8A9BF|nr:ubiquitin carboxyl-terminal hydrolase 1 [Ischnura elegans]XP_046393823.1 ubiquitin carboxyl-terminal hydrolase 1 [Ischnura elegans]XP_046393830.1 ubiquitin carboxyl-terminal hydrolase 1 [Ischnura elegans]
MTVFREGKESGSSTGPPKKKSCLSLSRSIHSLNKQDLRSPVSLSESFSSPTSQSSGSSYRSIGLLAAYSRISDQEMMSSSRADGTLTSITAASNYLFPSYAAHNSNGRLNPYGIGVDTNHSVSRNDHSEFGFAASLCNLGNTCFLNSVLYTLRFAPCFLHNLHHLVMDLQKVYGKDGSGSLGRSTTRDGFFDGYQTLKKFEKSKIQIATEKLHDLYVSLHTAEKKECGEPFQPDGFLHALRDVNQIFEGNQQHDAHELLMCLLNNIRDTCQQLANAHADCQGPSLELDLPGSSSSSSSSTTSSTSSRRTWNMHKTWKKKKSKGSAISMTLKGKKDCADGKVGDVLTDVALESSTEHVAFSSNTKEKAYPNPQTSVPNFISRDFEGVTLLRTKCLECEHVTEQRETFCDICVPITSDFSMESGELPLRPSDIFRSAILASENLRDLNKYWCEQCLRYNEACRTVRYESLPRLLILHLNRFSAQPSENVGSHHSSKAWPMTCMYKVKNYMPTPMTLDCFCETCRESEMEPTPHSYRLYGVIMHIGASIASGHYVSYVRASQSEYEYYQCDYDQCSGLGGSSVNCNLAAGAGKGSTGSGSSGAGGLFKFFKPKQADFSKTSGQGNMCRSSQCCGMRMNRAALAAFNRGYTSSYRSSNTLPCGAASYSPENRMLMGGHRQVHMKDPVPSVADTSVPEDPWLVCDDESIQPLTRKEFEEILAPRSSTVTALTPYLLFYAKCP